MSEVTKNKIISVESAKIIYDSLLAYISEESTGSTNIFTTTEASTDDPWVIQQSKILILNEKKIAIGDLIISKDGRIYIVDGVVSDGDDNTIVLNSSGIIIEGGVGKTPDIQIGEVQTLPFGSEAYATISGKAEAPELNLGIPMGAPGDGEGASIIIESEMSDTSVNAVQNKVIKTYIDGLIGDVESAMALIQTIIGGE